MKKLVLCFVLIFINIAFCAKYTPKTGIYYFNEMKASIKEIIKENQNLINKNKDGSIKTKQLTSKVFYKNTFTMFKKLMGADYIVSSLKKEKDPTKISKALTSLLSAGRITIAKEQITINTEQDGSVVKKKFIPAVFGRLVSDRFEEKTGLSIKQTTLGKDGLIARNPYNIPDKWETKTLKKITNINWKKHKGHGEYKGVTYRYMKPIYMKKACLVCHGRPKDDKGPYGHPKEGYTVKDVRGGISITIPLEK